MSALFCIWNWPLAVGRKTVENRELAHQVTEEVNQVILGKKEQVEEVFLAFLSDGHVLLNDIPGTGKTTMALSFARAMELTYHRVQFTPDVMPSDLTGFSIYNREKESFVYQEGSVFCNLLLADEINRTSPKTQSALLEVMEERRVSVEGVTREVPQPFLVIATQNPTGSAGTQRLPESQEDRFLISVTLGYPGFEDELTMAKEVSAESRLEKIGPVISKEDLILMQQEIHQVYMKDSVYQYLLELVTATRSHPYLERGASPRATIALVKMGKASAWMAGRDYVTPQDIADQLPYVAAHRVQLNASAKMEGKQVSDILKDILSQVKKPSMGEEAS